MEKEIINWNTLGKMKSLKRDKVYKKGNIVYKYAPKTEELVDIIDNYKNKEVMKSIIIPRKKLILANNKDFKNEGRYFGYTMDYCKFKKIDAMKQNQKFNLENYLLKLIKIVEKLNELGLIYYDFHEENVLVCKNNQPFLIDIDDLNKPDKKYELIIQKEYLMGFILNAYLNKGLFVDTYICKEAFRKAFSDKFINYLYDILSRQTIYDLPYEYIKEFKDKEKIAKLKKALKQ